ncbi:hypothetical protein MMC25_001810 [Agyrium rufum]|nr:hypothetical protein [Agyrium rufum]
MRLSDAQTSERLYLAQAPLSDLPSKLRGDLPVPELVLKAGKGDVYDANLWMGIPPTYTPFHRDPNPNLLVQLAGAKEVRILSPEAGDRVYREVRERIGSREGKSKFRGEEMMAGEERKLLEEAIWSETGSVSLNGEGLEGFQAHLDRGDGIFIPHGWWHSIRGVGEGISGSVSANVSAA